MEFDLWSLTANFIFRKCLGKSTSFWAKIELANFKRLKCKQAQLFHEIFAMIFEKTLFPKTSICFEQFSLYIFTNQPKIVVNNYVKILHSLLLSIYFINNRKIRLYIWIDLPFKLTKKCRLILLDTQNRSGLQTSNFFLRKKYWGCCKHSVL